MRSIDNSNVLTIDLDNSNKHKKYNNFYLISWAIICITFGFFIYQLSIFYKNKLENDRLVLIKKEYDYLISEINNYEQLKNQYNSILNESYDLNTNKEELQKKITILNNEIENFESKIIYINKKIKSFS